MFIKMRKTESLQVRCTPLERKALEAVAQAEGRKMSEMLRELIREGAQKRGLWPPIISTCERD